LRVAVVRVDGEDGAIEEHGELLQSADVDQQRRRIDVAEYQSQGKKE
jgi:hypothetical protein